MLDGYFHQDYVAEYGSFEGAARAFAKDATKGECLLVASELDGFIALAEMEPRQAWLARLRQLGGAWRPRSVESLQRVVSVLKSDTV